MNLNSKILERSVVLLILFTLTQGVLALESREANRPFIDNDLNSDPNWDWTENASYSLYVLGPSGDTLYQNIRLPYFSEEGPAAILNTGDDRDIQRADGWRLVYRDFGTPDDPTVLPRFILYNIFRGTLRVFYFNTASEPFTHGIAYLKQPNPARAAALFTFGEKEYFLTDFDEELVISSVHEIGYLQWCFADFNIIGYDNDLALDATLEFEIHGHDVSEIVLEGSLGGENPSLPATLGEGSILGSTSFFMDGFKKGYQNFHNLEKAKKNLSKMAKDNPDAWYAHIFKDIVSSSLGQYGPIVGAAVGIVTHFISGNRRNQSMAVKSQPLALTGSLENQNQLFNFFLRIPGAPRSEDDGTGMPLYDYPLGVFNLVERPVFDYQVMFVCDEENTNCTNQLLYRLSKPLKYIVNPLLVRKIDILFPIGPVKTRRTDMTIKTGSADIIAFRNPNAMESIMGDVDDQFSIENKPLIFSAADTLVSAAPVLASEKSYFHNLKALESLQVKIGVSPILALAFKARIDPINESAGDIPIDVVNSFKPMLFNNPLLSQSL